MADKIEATYRNLAVEAIIKLAQVPRGSSVTLITSRRDRSALRPSRSSENEHAKSLEAHIPGGSVGIKNFKDCGDPRCKHIVTLEFTVRKV